MKCLKNHPFAVEAHFDRSLVLTFAVPKGQLQDRIPPCLTLDTYLDRWAFVAVAMVQTKGLRPKGFPPFMGRDFFLVGYRIFVRYTNQEGRRLRGLYILKSETDKKIMALLGNIFTHYHYSATDIDQVTNKSTTMIRSTKSAFHVVIDESASEATLPANSPFADWKAARRYAGPLPHTFTVDVESKTILTILGVRQNWKPQPVVIKEYSFSFIDSMALSPLMLANAFKIENIPYHWEKGRIESWQ